MPLLEIVTAPQLNHPEDGKLAVKELQDLLKALKISNANMEEVRHYAEGNRGK